MNDSRISPADSAGCIAFLFEDDYIQIIARQFPRDGAPNTAGTYDHNIVLGHRHILLMPL
jgi:hypothetical protein